jgi:hypothetical protein
MCKIYVFPELNYAPGNLQVATLVTNVLFFFVLRVKVPTLIFKGETAQNVKLVSQGKLVEKFFDIFFVINFYIPDAHPTVRLYFLQIRPQFCAFGRGGTWTHNLRFKRPLLYQLSYALAPAGLEPAILLYERRVIAYLTMGKQKLGREGIAPTTSGFSDQRSANWAT